MKYLNIAGIILGVLLIVGGILSTRIQASFAGIVILIPSAIGLYKTLSKVKHETSK